MSLGNPFVATAGFNKKLEANRIRTGFGSLNNYGDSTPPDASIGANGSGFPYDVYGFRPHISLIFLFTDKAIIKQIEASCYRTQIGSGAGAEGTTGTWRLFCRIVGFRGLGVNQQTLARTIFDPLGWSKQDAVIRLNAAGLAGIDYEAAAAWEGEPAGRFYRWLTATNEIFYDKLITQDTQFSWDVNLTVGENDILLMTPCYSDRNYHDTATGFPLNVFQYAGSPPPTGGGTDFRNFQVLRTICISGENC